MSLGFIDEPWNDADHEQLGVKKEISALCDFILSCQTPMTIAIQGDWGTGKTSVMEMVKSQIQSKCDCIWFNTWQFSQFQLQDDVPLALMSELLELVGDEDKSHIKEFFGGMFKKGKNAIGAIAELGAGVPGISRVFENLFQGDVINQAAQLKRLKEEFKKIIEKRLASTKKSRLVLFIDDLDRMEPGKAVELLEVIKIFLDIKDCVFVLAVDYGVVSRGVRKKYGEDMDELKGRSFFDKIIQLPFNLPVANYTVGNYLKNLLNIPGESVNAYRNLAAASVGANPRTLKRMANILYLLQLVDKKSEEESEIPPERRLLLFAALCLQMAFETVYSQMLADGGRQNLLEENSERLLARFSEALERAPGKKDELQKKLLRFFKALNEALTNIGEDSWEQFCEVMYKTGLTASGSAQPMTNLEAVKKTFDPMLVNNFTLLVNEINEKYKNYLDTLKVKLKVDADNPTELWIPAIFSWAISLMFRIEESGISAHFYSAENAELKNGFKSWLNESGVELPEKMQIKSGRAHFFMSSPVIPWKNPVSKKDAQASEARFEQAKDVVFNWLDSFALPMEKFYASKAKIFSSISSLVDKIEEEVKTVLPEDQGWIYWRGDFGCSLFEEWSLLTIRKADWDENSEIRLTAKSGSACTMYWAFANYNENFSGDKKTQAFYSIWKKEVGAISGVDENEGVDQNEYLSGWVYFPGEIADWTSGNFGEDDFAFALSAEKEKEVLEFCEKCAEAFKKAESAMDKLAARGK